MTQLSGERLELQQVLHGYRDGHRLLKSSIRLPQEALRELLILSDLSGPNPPAGFKSYVNGYPLSGTNYYAFARTWMAHEMKRPGCVWTHTLLIENADMARLQDATALDRLFRRPKIPDDGWSSWANSIEMRVDGLQALDIPGEEVATQLGVAKSLLGALYGNRKAVVVAVDWPNLLEPVVLAIWSQQWPRLRRGFRFCTGALAFRKFGSAVFDLQLFPRSRLRQRSDLKDAVILDDVSPNLNPMFSPDSWVHHAARDLASRSGSELRRFLWGFGADLSVGREVFPDLVNLFLRAGRPEPTSTVELISMVGSSFPQPEEAARLKASLFGAPARRSRSLGDTTREEDLLFELAIAREHQAFDAAGLQFGERAADLWAHDEGAARQLMRRLIEAELTPLGEDLLRSMCRAAPLQSVVSLATEQPRFLTVIVRGNPSLALEKEVWLAAKTRAVEVMDVLAAAELSTDDRRAIVATLIEAGDESLAADIVRRFGADAVSVAMDSVARQGIHSPIVRSFSWHRVIQAGAREVVNWLREMDKVPEAALAFVTKVLDPHSAAVREGGADAWRRAVSAGLTTLGEDARLQVMAFVLALGFENPGDGSVDLVVASFEAVHEAARRNRLEYDAWSLLREQVPPLSWWREWDRCERLRRGLVAKFLSHQWPADKFFEALRSEYSLERALESCELTDEARRWRAELFRIIETAEIPAWQREIARRFSRQEG